MLTLGVKAAELKIKCNRNESNRNNNKLRGGNNIKEDNVCRYIITDNSICR
ncbi:hypothetical protein SPRA44_480010 [Serratia proteamaculans]|nr:hypothetical protein SPRA44_480010 [Serratia proteamaculans]